MKVDFRDSLAVSALLALVAGCGGGGGGAEAGTAMTQTFAFVTPALGAQQIYAQTVIDNSGNSIAQTVRDTVTAVHADGSYDDVQDDPTGTSLTVNGTLYAISPETFFVSNAGENESYSYTPAGYTSSISCQYLISGVSGKYPHSVGQSWNFSYIVACAGYAPSLYTEAGSVVDVESVTVPAGTFTALKTLSTVASTNATGTTTTQTITTWRDTATLHS